MKALVFQKRSSQNLAFRNVFEEYQQDSSFIRQLQALHFLAKECKATYGAWIDMAPSDEKEVGRPHFNFGILVQDCLFIIDPVGKKAEKGRKKALDYFKKVQSQLIALGIRKIVFSDTFLQQDPEEKLVSCGPLCVEFIHYCTRLRAEEI